MQFNFFVQYILQKFQENRKKTNKQTTKQTNLELEEKNVQVSYGY